MRQLFLIPLALVFTATLALAETYVVAPGTDAAEKLQEALILAKDGDIILLAEGRYPLFDGLSLDVDGVTIRGAGMDATILDFADQKGAGEGLLVTSDNVVLEDFAVGNSKGDGIKTKGSDIITFRRLRVEWTGGPEASNGAYGVYPVESTDVLIEDSLVRGASDAGIYVEQSDCIIVRRNRAEFNVAGIEIESSYNADVYDNVATRNTGGILVFDLPNLKQNGGRNVRVFNNEIVNNDTPNFAPEGNIVATVPMGTGVLIMANRNVHVFKNRFDNNAMIHIGVVSYFEDYEDDDYQPHPRGIVIRDNDYGRGGFEPSGEVGLFFAEAAGGEIPDVL
ncbi:MAG: parallel beta-helix domain-containing protein [Paracoccaceae bacterium]|nr:parallel beta-helix domain-containing protein [Paracoccaceae bacterium]MDG1369401.1 parallel beta-helix domain-containing protein [Paracoccaceae bacterium]